MELAVRWNQRSTPADPKFLIVDVPGRTFKLCRVDSTKGRAVQWREVSKNTRAPQFRAFDWNFLHNVVAVGQWSGEVTVLGLENDAPILSIPLKTHRACNSVAFGPDSLLATGLERVRNDFCLNVYDLAQWYSYKRDGLSRQPANEPLRKLAVAEGIISIKFFPQDSNVLVTGVKGVGIRIYDLRDNQSSPAVQFNTSCVHNIAVDPCNTHFFASAGPTKDDTVQIWDRRSAGRQNSNLTGQNSSSNEPLLELRNVFRGSHQSETPTIWSLRYSIAEQGSLGVLGNNGSIRIFETKRDWVDEDKGNNLNVDELVLPLSVTRTESLGSSPHLEERHATVNEQEPKILAFDFLNVKDAKGNSNAITMRTAAEIELRRLHRRGPAVATRFNSRSGIAISDNSARLRTGLRMYQASQRGKISDDALYSMDRRSRPPGLDPESSSEDEDMANDGWMDDSIRANTLPEDMPMSDSYRRRQSGHVLRTVEDALTIAERARRRCMEGYLLDPTKNAGLVRDDPELEMMWTWIAIAKEHADSGTLSQGPVNFNYLGVLNIWQNDVGSDVSTRLRPGTSVGDVWKRIIEQVKDLDLPKIEIPETGRAYHRWLCLHILGIDARQDTLLARVKAMALAGHNSEAALYALLARNPALASTALKSGPRNTQNKALSFLLSVYATSEDRSSLTEQLEAITASEKDPFIQAIKHLLKTRIANDEPSGLPMIPSLPPRYHIALAFSLLSDGILKNYLFEQYREAVSGGLLSYMALTGLSQLSLRIFKRYLVRTSDLQSVVLALSYVCPLYINKPRMKFWRFEYRSNLNRYGLFIQRAQFDMQSTKLATRLDGTTAIEPQKRQISLKCANCDSTLHREPDHLAPEGTLAPNTSLFPNSLTKTPTQQSSVSDPSSLTNSSDPGLTPSDPSNSLMLPTHNPLTATSLALPPTPSADSRRTTGFRTPTSPHGSIYDVSGNTNNNPITPGLSPSGATSSTVNAAANIAPILVVPAPTSSHPQIHQQQQSQQQQLARLFPAPRDGTICPKCGARMPRCAVCEFWIGETDPRSRGARAAAAASKVSTEKKAVKAGQRILQSTQSSGDRVLTRNPGTFIDKKGMKEDGKEAGEEHDEVEGEEEEKEEEEEEEEEEEDVLSGFVEFCLRCKHVYHRAHAMLWFGKHAECAAVGCRCVCAL